MFVVSSPGFRACGCEGTPHPGMPQVVLKKTEEAIADSDVVLFMVDARQGVTESDRHYARHARAWHYKIFTGRSYDII